MLKKDNWLLGIALGVVVPAIIYGIVFLVVRQWGTIDETLNIYFLKQSTMQLMGIFVNMFTFRYYMVNLKYDKTGRGILLATFAYAGVFVYMHVI
ncbi:MAG: hypothetical protein ACOC12_06085 [Bacteroidota bacterium]